MSLYHDVMKTNTRRVTLFGLTFKTTPHSGMMGKE